MALLKTQLILGVFVVCYVNIIRTIPTVDKDGTRKATRVDTFVDGLPGTRMRVGDALPEELEFYVIADGEEPIRSRSHRVPNVKTMPLIDSWGNEVNLDRKNQQFYVGENGAFQVSTSPRSDGSLDTDMKATYKNGRGEKCFYVRGESHCWRIDSTGTFEAASAEGGEARSPKAAFEEGRKKRQSGPLVYTDFNVTRVLKIVYVVDMAFMEWFRSLSDDDTTAIQDAGDYIFLLNNELNYLFRGIKEISENSSAIPDMDITCYAQGFYYPRLGTEWSWLVPWKRAGSIDVSTGAHPVFGRWVGRGNLDRSGSFDKAAFISPLGLRSDGFQILGRGYFDSICNPSLENLRVTVNQDSSYDVAIILAHEIGHTLSVRHDDSAECPSGTYIMSAVAPGNTTIIQDTFNRWSTCSVTSIVEHVSTFPGCLLDGDVSNDNFYDQLCRGLRADRFDLDYQCKVATGLEDSVVCSPNATAASGKVFPDACFASRAIGCTGFNVECGFRLRNVFDGTPCEGTNAANDYVCYRGDCLEKVDVCAARPTSVPPTVCSCTGRFRFGCCREGRGPNGSCCNGCRLSFSSTRCVPDMSVRN